MFAFTCLVVLFANPFSCNKVGFLLLRRGTFLFTHFSHSGFLLCSAEALPGLLSCNVWNTFKKPNEMPHLTFCLSGRNMIFLTAITHSCLFYAISITRQEYVFLYLYPAGASLRSLKILVCVNFDNVIMSIVLMVTFCGFYSISASLLYLY